MNERLRDSYDDKQSGEIINQPEKLHEISKFFLETSSNVEEATERTACVIGVQANIKPAGLIGFAYNPEQEQQQKQFEENLQELGLVFTKVGQSDAYYHYFISKEMDTAQALKETFAKLWSQENKGEITDTDTELGRLLGYPETAINYVRSGKASGVEKLQRRPDTLIVHDPAHFEEEYNAYEKPIYDIMDETCPELSAARKRYEKRQFGNKLLRLFNRK